ncbi:MAG: protein-glutamate O-methyltransferase CheR [Gammaproteobacteria bacterium]|nr:protein-glutamate O-methyltransferase CheR [Gammaproteobacteria bacterium]
MSAEPNFLHEREFSFSDKDFKLIREYVMEHTGISLSDAKKNMVYSRLSRRLRQLNIDKFSDYLKIVQSDNSDELGNFINAITTNLTSFFREPHHFDYLAKTIIPELLQANARTHRIRIWSAGCSTGEEPYSIAVTLREAIPNFQNWDVKILATDLDTNVVAHAKAGVYDVERLKGMSENRRRWFKRGKGEHEGSAKASSELQSMITFKQLNLMNAWPMKGPFDVIFCRNVVIYFDKDTQRQLFARYAELLRSDGHIFLGHSESLFKVSDRFRLIGNTMYQRTK